ncbi:glycosyltransferase family 2 protein [Sodalis sp. RH21]|uniref:glycosyltransferase family 2 protein n=1 Tax=unclassified Sodalis (in: enterobacteria) TaxID=2636512 RepID=UPI0039B6AA08
MKLTIIIPCYNAQNSIGKLLSSLAKQQVIGVEIIIVNDGSTDNTENIVNAFLTCNVQMPICIYNTKNSGAAAAREYGLIKAKGEYISYCDSDDDVASNFINAILVSSEIKPDMIYYSSNIVKEIELNKKTHIKKVFFEKDFIYKNGEELLNYLLTNGYYTAAVWSYVFRRELAISSGAKFTARPVHEDHMFTIKLLLNSTLIVTLKEVLYLQNLRAGSLTNSTKSPHYISERYNAYLEVKNILKNRLKKKCIYLYSKWSVHGFLKLCKSSPKSFIIALIKQKLFVYFWQDRAFLLPFIFFAIFKK